MIKNQKEENVCYCIIFNLIRINKKENLKNRPREIYIIRGEADKFQGELYSAEIGVYTGCSLVFFERSIINQ